MTRRLAIHIGAQKCASSSLQASLRLFQNSCKNNSFSFVFLNPAQLRSLSNALTQKIESPFRYIDRILSELTADFSVISHEMLGNRPALVHAIRMPRLRPAHLSILLGHIDWLNLLRSCQLLSCTARCAACFLHRIRRGCVRFS